MEIESIMMKNQQICMIWFFFLLIKTKLHDFVHTPKFLSLAKEAAQTKSEVAVPLAYVHYRLLSL